MSWVNYFLPEGQGELVAICPSVGVCDSAWVRVKIKESAFRCPLAPLKIQPLTWATLEQTNPHTVDGRNPLLAPPLRNPMIHNHPPQGGVCRKDSQGPPPTWDAPLSINHGGLQWDMQVSRRPNRQFGCKTRKQIHAADERCHPRPRPWQIHVFLRAKKWVSSFRGPKDDGA